MDEASITEADVEIYLVKSMPNSRAVHPSNSKAAFIAEICSTGGASPDFGLAQEVGHILGLPESADDPNDSGNVMTDGDSLTGGSQIRREDWLGVNPETL